MVNKHLHLYSIGNMLAQNSNFEQIIMYLGIQVDIDHDAAAAKLHVGLKRMTTAEPYFMLHIQ